MIGRGDGCDIALPLPGLKPVHAELVLDGNSHRIVPMDPKADISVNGTKTKMTVLEPWDVIRVGSVTMIYVPDDFTFKDSAGREDEAFHALEAMSTIGRKLMETTDLDVCLEMLLDETLAISRANKGFIIFVENGTPVVKVARNVGKHELPDEATLFSESIVRKALEDGEPQLVADASTNKEFSAATSVVNLRLASVMCVPLKSGGEILGVLYLGTERLLDLFDDITLKIITVYAALAASIVNNVLLINSLVKDRDALREEVKVSRFGQLIGSCEGMRAVFDRVTRVAPTDVPVLITGETGTGKELIAREVHGRSLRANGPFVAINCGAIPENLIESELFGHVKGSFTGASTTTMGKFQAASGGTLFLDEIAELPTQMQVKLLRVLQDGMVMKVGGNKPEQVDIRLIAATNRNLDDEIVAGRFREDLYYRIAVVGIRLPPLRERGEDIDTLSQYFLKRFSAEFKTPVKSFSPEAIAAMRVWNWPGNIREMENRVRKAVLFVDGPVAGVEALDFERGRESAEMLTLAVARENFELRYVMEALKRHGDNRAATARALGVDTRTIFRYLEKDKQG
jgi:transcriptional regulator with GAF, ATPase, and Fis domain